MQNSSTFDINLFIQEIKNTPCIWNYQSSDYPNRLAWVHRKQKAWEDISKKFTDNYDDLSAEEKMDVEKQLQRKWKTLRDGFNRDILVERKMSGTTETGAPRRQYYHFKELSFLLPLAEGRRKPERMDGSHESSNEYEEVIEKKKPKVTVKTKRKILKKRKVAPIQNCTVPKKKQITHSEDNQIQEYDVDRYFLLSLVSDLRSIPEDYKIDAKSEIIEIIRKYRHRDPISTNVEMEEEINTIKCELESDNSNTECE